MTHHTVSLTVTRDGDEIEVEVVASYESDAGVMYGPPESCVEPSEDVEIDSVSGGVELTEAEVERVWELVCESAA